MTLQLQDARALKIGELLSKNPSDPVKELLGKIITEESIAKNIGYINISGITKPTMVATIEFLKALELKTHYSTTLLGSKANTKLPIAKDIVHFIFSLLPVECNVCSAQYVADDNERPEVICYICQRGCHPGCYSDAQVSVQSGILFFCSSCLPRIKTLHVEYGSPDSAKSVEKTPEAEPKEAKPKEAKPEEAKPKEGLKKPEDAGTTPDDLGISKIVGEFSPEEPAPKQRTTVNSGSQPAKKDFSVFAGRDICPLLLKGICPHGISGAGCNAFHPKRCNYFVAAGNDRRHGCTMKGRCKFYHPKLCENAVKLRTCLNQDCKEVHFRGTRRSMRETWKKRGMRDPRYGPPFRRERQPAYISEDIREKQQGYTPDLKSDFPPIESSKKADPRAINDGLLPTPPQKPCNATAENDNSKHFLMLLEQMKSDLSLQFSQQISNLFSKIQQPQQVTQVHVPSPLDHAVLMPAPTIGSQYQTHPFPMSQQSFQTNPPMSQQAFQTNPPYNPYVI